MDDTKFDISRLASILAPACENAAIGDRTPALRRLPLPLRWVARGISHIVYKLARPLTNRQAAVNRSLLEAVQMIGEKVAVTPKVLVSTTPVEAAPLISLPVPQTVGPRIQFNPNHGETGPRSITQLNNQWSWMLYAERVVLYSAVYGLRPKRCLEIGTFLGGSALIIAAAMDDADQGLMVCVDPNPRIPPENWAQFEHRCHLVTGPSPEALLIAEQKAGGKFELALIDGDHSYDAVIRDIRGTIPVLADQAFMLFHDAHNPPVAEGIREMLVEHAEVLTDVGMMSTPRTEIDGISWGGIRMVRFDRKK